MKERGGAFAALVAGGWMAVGVLLATQAWVARGVRGDPVALGQTMAIWLSWSAIWAALTPIALWLLRRFPLAGPRIGLALLVHLVASALVASLDLAIYALIAPVVGAQSAGPDWWTTLSHLFGTTLILNIPVYWLVIGIAHTVSIVQANRERERRELQLTAKLSESRLAALQAQLQPHFLFNALNTIAVLMQEDVSHAHRTLLQLSQLLRRALDSGSKPVLSLREEVAFLQAYLAIETTRFQHRLVCTIDVDEQLMDLEVPALVLQPLVENAVRHGLAEGGAQGRIAITARRAGESACLTVRDNGCGMGDEHAEGIGLSNTRARLQLLYGERHQFTISPAEGGGTIATLLLPMGELRA